MPARRLIPRRCDVRRLFDNFVYKLVALLVAGLLWATAQGLGDVEGSIDMQVAVEDVPEDLVVVDQSSHEINLHLVGSRAGLRHAKKTMSSYRVSLAGVKPGEARFSVTNEGLALPRNAKVTARSPTMLVFHTERVVSKEVPIRADVVGEPPEGYRVTGVQVEPSQIRIAGARSSVRRVREVSTDRVDVSKLRASTTLEIAPVMGAPHVWREDARGEAVQVHVNVEAPPPAAETPPAEPPAPPASS